MKKFLLIITLILSSIPVVADVINPHFSPTDRMKIREQRFEKYKNIQRQNYIVNICNLKNKSDLTDKKSIDSCKAELKKEYESTIKLVDKYAKENKRYEKTNLKNASK